ncbi:CDK inhibitor P21 binding protein [Artemisia annua]|uniref:CDK inhibitor P21 binding protein n=1 Tax=Artemisia annua TaxID=35608 RepID=A0A2U1PZQ8_ARTAN|nr:CDK inhibitor P21 binding protein [Artemisia annua]
MFLGSRTGKHDDTESESEREESYSSSEDEDLSSGGVVQADFAFFDPKPDDFHGVKVLMTTYLDFPFKSYDMIHPTLYDF